jgi:hypothetical protein
MLETRETIARCSQIQALKRPRRSEPKAKPRNGRTQRCDSLLGMISISARSAYVLMKIPFRFISSAGGFGEKRNPSALLIFPALMRR